ncbi:polysaccharide deacetylase family protein [Alkalihalobacillus sp. BA299]|uniref:polysaccharide deacetylase family protein n=1 Tax=Alkalihalobacillus sp. BA299 TaxID=2815938 RepID=UPI0027DBA59D|nr:polysaccharide deacetylase family protein [Alkalihalobacillus sp. BA299]
MIKKVLQWFLITVFLTGFLVQTNIEAKANEKHADEVNQEWWFKKDKDNPRQVEGLPNLEGGDEEAVRRPISNIVLQQQYPDTVILRGPDTANRVALTFDDGPDPRYTEQVLDVLAQYNVPATFFVMGARAEAYPDIVRRMVNEGHIVGNHSYWHPNLVDGDIPTLEHEVNQTEEVLNNIIGYRPSLFRAPYGFLDNQAVEKLAEMNYNVIGWSLDTLDWREPPPEDIAFSVLSNIHPGAIVLLHDGAEWDGDRTNTVQSLHQIIPELQELGFEFVTVPELLNIPYQK